MRVPALRLILPVALVILPAAVILPRALAPEPTHLTPTYDVWVVSESDHHPLAGIAVTERFGDDNPQTLTSDAQGHVHFESRVAPGISLIRRLFTRPSVRLPLGATNFATISAAGRGFGTSAEKMSWVGPPGAMGMRISMYPVVKPVAATGQHPTAN